MPSNLKPKLVNDIQPDHPIAIMTTQQLKRVSSQKGCFTIHGYSDNAIDSHIPYGDAFQVIKIDTSEKSKKSLLRSLAKLGVNSEFIYQDLDSLSERVIDETERILRSHNQQQQNKD